LRLGKADAYIKVALEGARARALIQTLYKRERSGIWNNIT